jgi:glutathione S-transferase
MFCYGEKEPWYKKIVPSGMLPAIKLDDRVVTESDVVLKVLEDTYGPLGKKMTAITPQRQLERTLFRAWCEWLCYPSSSAREESEGEAAFVRTLALFEAALGDAPGPWLLGGADPSSADLVFVPYVERMCASLFYYKGFLMRDRTRSPNLCRWLDALEARPTYRGTQSDFHTHVHDLPPQVSPPPPRFAPPPSIANSALHVQMGGCYASGSPEQKKCAAQVDCGPWTNLPDTGLPEPPTCVGEAIQRVAKHKDAVIACNPCEPAVVDEALRCALTLLATGEAAEPPAGSDVALRYVRDRVNVPSDMSLHAARRLRAALEETAALSGDASGPPISMRDRRDQDPRAFRHRSKQVAG